MPEDRRDPSRVLGCRLSASATAWFARTTSSADPNAQQGTPIFDPDPAVEDLQGNRPLAATHRLFWSVFFQPADQNVLPAMKIDHRLSTRLRHVPERGALAKLNLRRGVKWGLPSGQTVAAAIKADPLTKHELWLGVENFDREADRRQVEAETPLWFYMLREAGARNQGEYLGPVGRAIVAEVFISILERDPNRYLKHQPKFKPHLWPTSAPSNPGHRWSLFLHQAYVHFDGDWDRFSPRQPRLALSATAHRLEITHDELAPARLDPTEVAERLQRAGRGLA